MTLTKANALPEKTDFLTTNPLLVSGNEIAPATKPALRRAATRGAMALAVLLFEKTRICAFSCVAIVAIALAYALASRLFKRKAYAKAIATIATQEFVHFLV